MLFQEIDAKWRECTSAAQREIRWGDLTHPAGKWLTACREFSNPDNAMAPDTHEILQQWLSETATPDNPLYFCKQGFSAEHQARELRALLYCASILRNNGQYPAIDTLIPVAEESQLAPGLIFDIASYLFEQELRPATTSIQFTALLIDQEENGVPATLTLEKVPDGTGQFYPHPEFLLCRDTAFRESEAAAHRCAFNAAPSVDIRWNLKRLDQPEPGHLTGPSMGAAFAFGIHLLTDEAVSFDQNELRRTAITATIDEHSNFSSVGGLWNKLDREAVDKANVLTLVVANNQENVPPQFMSEQSPFTVIQAQSLSDAAEQISTVSLTRRTILTYLRERESQLGFRLPEKQAPIATCFQIPQLYRRRKQTPGHVDLSENGAQSPDKLSSDKGLTWDELQARIDQHYESAELETLFKPNDASDHEAPRLLLLGSPGSGKTALSQYIAWSAAVGTLFPTPRIPARIRMREWEEWAEDNRETRLADYLFARYRSRDELTSPPTLEHWRQWLLNGDVVVIVDAIDETTDPQCLKKRSRELLSYTNAPLIVTCRTTSHKHSEPQFQVFQKVWIGPLSDAQRNAYIEHYPAVNGIDHQHLIDVLDNSFRLRDLSRNPLFLSIICFAVDGSAIPQTPAALLARIVRELLARPKLNEIDYPGKALDLDEKKSHLAQAALHLFASFGETFTEAALIDALGESLAKAGYGTAPARPWANPLRHDLADNSGLLSSAHYDTATGKTPLQSFIHPIIQQYLAAFALSEKMDDDTLDETITVRDQSVTLRELVNGIEPTDQRWEEVMEYLEESVKF